MGSEEVPLRALSEMGLTFHSENVAFEMAKDRMRHEDCLTFFMVNQPTTLGIRGEMAVRT